jgi:hypothetical protein
VENTSTHVAMSRICRSFLRRVSQDGSGTTTISFADEKVPGVLMRSCSGSNSDRSMYSQARMESVSFLGRVGILFEMYDGGSGAGE